MSPIRLAAFVEYVARPLMDDIKQILEQFNTLGFRYDAEAFLKAARHLVLCHIGLELLRYVVYLLMTGLVCWTAWSILSLAS